MTYQEIVNRIQTIVNYHLQLADFGYGDLSDLKTRFENTSGDSAVQADYPYLFLNPATHTRNLTTMTYNFNMLVMDMARGEVADQPYNNILAIQSQCQQMIDDVIADLYYGFKDQPEVMRTNMSYTPFNERFQDNVAGMTASLSIEVPTGLNLCVAPIDKRELLITRRATFIHTLDFDGYPDGQDNFYNFKEYSYDGITWVNSNNFDPQYGLGYRSFMPVTSQRYKLEFDIDTKWLEPEDGSGELKYGIRIARVVNGVPQVEAEWLINEPWTSDTTIVNLSHSFNLDLTAGEEYYFYVAQGYAAIPTADVIGYQEIPSTVKIYGIQ